MNRKFQSMLKQQWTNRLLALFMCASLLLSSVAARPLAQSYDAAPPTPTAAPVVNTATPEPASPTQDSATPTEVAATPTEEPASPTAEAATPTAEPVTPTVEPATPTAEPASPTPTEIVPTQQPQTPLKPAQAVNPKVASSVNFHQLVIKFKGGYVSSLSSQSLSSQSLPGVAPLLDLLKGAPIKPFFNSLKKTTGAQATSQAAQSESVLSRYFVAQLPDSTDFAGAQQILDSITALPFIDTAYMEPIYKPATISYIAQQNYLFEPGVPNNGMGVTDLVPANCPDCAWTQEPVYGQGQNVNVYDIEQGWQIGHEDLPINKSNLINSANTSQQNWVDHGTAVLGVIGASQTNGVGVVGIAPRAALWMISSIQSSDLTPRSLADSINLAVTTGKPGDIIVLPLEALGPVSEEVSNCPDPDSASFEDIPVEYWQANFDTISAATTAGFVVVEAAGNGQMNLSADRYNDKFDRDSRDSGAIIVGAGTSDTRSPVCSTNYGSRVDLQGWGENVTTTGYGDLQNLGDPTTLYTEEFGGTSAATAMVAGAVASFQGIALHRHYTLTPEEIRNALHDTGTAQDTSITTNNIGPLPNLIDAINKKIPATVKLLTPPDAGPDLNTLRPTLDWASFSNATQYELQVDKTSTSNVSYDFITSSSIYTFTTSLSEGENYYWRVRPFVNSEWLPYSDYFQFGISHNIIVVPATTLSAPANGALFNHPADPVDFKWNTTTSSAVTGYELQVSTAADFSALFGDFFDPAIPGEGKTHTFSGATLDPNTKYYWRVRCVISGSPDNYSAWSSSRTLYTSLDPVGSLTAPPNGTPVDSLSPLFTWAVAPGAKAYYLQVGNNSSFSSVAFSATINIASGDTVPDNFYQMKSNLPRNRTAANPLFWRVRDLGKYGWSDYTDYFTVTTGTPPGVPSLTKPGSNAIVAGPDAVEFDWSTPTGAFNFYLQVSYTSDFSDFTGGVDDPFAVSPEVVTLNPNTKYYWRVRAGDIVPTWGSWSSTHVFYTTPHDPDGLVSLPSPTDSLSPTFNWNPSLEVSSYRIQVLKYAAGICTTTPLADKTFTAPPPYTITVALNRNASMCWRLSAGGLYGYSNWATDTDEFTTLDPPYAPGLASPANGVSLATFAPLLTWTASPNRTTLSRAVQQYEVQISTSKSFTSPIDDFVDASKATKLQIGGTDLVDAGTYYWRVRALNTNESTFSVWSDTWSFVTPPQMEGTIYDATTVDPTQTPPYPGDVVPSVNLQISGTSWATTSDPSTGAYSFRGLPPGTYTLLISKGNYIRQTRKISISRGNNIEQDFDIVPIPPENVVDPTIKPSTVVIQLTWDSTVTNMDANLWLPKITSPCLVSKAPNHLDTSDPSGCGLTASDTHAFLTSDDDQIYGTEVITIDAFSNATTTDPYVFAVLLNDAASKMGGSGAKVTVYEGSDLKATFSVPSSANGIWWKVFTLSIKGATVNVNSVNTIGNKNPGP
jgi:serine protease